MARNANSEKNGQPEPGGDTFPIPSVLDEPNNQDLFPGSLHVSRALDMIQGDGGISETLAYVEELLKTLPVKVIEAQHSEEGEIELMETDASIQQALLIVAGLVQEASWQASKAVRN
ncbi:unnamed protein product [Penicillium bialowiezense]